MLIFAGVALIVAGVIWSVAERFGLGRLPGDVAIERENFRFYFPVTTSILISIVLSLLVWLFRR
jgi:heme/copper-type cytochrome/quinol oxidase subunit 2